MTSPDFVPLAGLRVVDLSQNLAGPFATQILGDLGADVVKVEPPGGDAARQWGPPFAADESPMFLCSNRNKRSIVLDLKTGRDREVLRRLIERADVFVHAFRSEIAGKLGFDEAAVRSLNPAVIYATVSAYGEDGPLAEQPGYDVLLQAHAGIMSVTGHPDRPPARVGTSVVDFGTATWLALAILAALRERDATGRGAHITTSLLDTAVSLMAYQIQGFQGDGSVPGRAGSGLNAIAPYQAFPTADSSIVIGAGNDAAFQRLCEALDMPEAGDDARFASNAERVRNRDVINAMIAERTSAEPSDSLLERLRGAGVPCGPIHDVADVTTDTQVAASGLLRAHADSSALGSAARNAGVSDVAAPPRWNGVRASLRRSPPRLGEHSAEILRELGLDP